MKIKAFLLILATIFICACTIGCNKFSNTDSNSYNVRYETVTAKVTELYHRNRKFYTYVYRPEKGYVTIQYEDITETFEDIDLYSKYKDKLNQEIEIKLKITSKNGEDVEWQLILEQ